MIFYFIFILLDYVSEADNCHFENIWLHFSRYDTRNPPSSPPQKKQVSKTIVKITVVVYTEK